MYSTQSLLSRSLSSKLPKSDYNDFIFNRVKDRLYKRSKGKTLAASQLSIRRAMMVDLAYSKLTSEDGIARLLTLQIFHPSLTLWDQIAVKSCSNSPLKEFLLDFNFWNISDDGNSNAAEIISQSVFLRYYEIVSFYTDSEAHFERNISLIFVVTPDDMLVRHLSDNEILTVPSHLIVIQTYCHSPNLWFPYMVSGLHSKEKVYCRDEYSCGRT
jgi:hypothetical protein